MNNLGKDNINTESPYCLGQNIQLCDIDIKVYNLNDIVFPSFEIELKEYDIELESFEIPFELLDIENLKWSP